VKSRFYPILVVAVVQVMVALPLLTQGYSLVAVSFGLEGIGYYYFLSGLAGVAAGSISVFILKEIAETDGKILPTQGVSSGLFGLLAALYASWLFSPLSLPGQTILFQVAGPRGPIDAWTSAFIYYMLYNLPFIYTYLDRKNKEMENIT